MTLVAGYGPEESDPGGLQLASMLARSTGEDLVVAAVVPAPWFPSMARIDAEYRAYVNAEADDALAVARSRLPTGLAATFVRHAARSVPAGLLELAEQHDARVIVLGSSSAGVFGHVALGSVTGRLLHSSPRPLALATRGFRTRTGTRVRRVTVAYGGSQAAEDLVVATAPIAAACGASLRLASFAVWSRPPYTSRLGTDTEDTVLAEWLAGMRAAAREVLAEVRLQPDVPHDLDGVVGIGPTWEAALDDVEWAGGDILVVGSSTVGSLMTVFLGSRATKIVRHSPVPVVVMPRAAGPPPDRASSS